MQKRIAIFLDRDGVLVKDTGENHPGKIEVLPLVLAGLKQLKERNLILIVISNQPAVAKGISTEEEVQKFHLALNNILKLKGCEIDAFYYCPHHPTNGIIGKYKKACDCRKPKPGMLLKAAHDFGIDLKKSFMVGDYTWDIQAGEKAGCKTILIKNTERKTEEIEQIIKESKPDFYCDDFKETAKLITSKL